MLLTGSRVGDAIRLEGSDPDGTLNRWQFSEISERGFLWQGFESTDGGESWFLRQTMTATRSDVTP